MSSIDKIVHDLSYEMAKISTDYNVEKDYNNQEKLHNLAREITLNEEEINFKINEMYADVEREANSLNTNIPSDLRYKIARNIETKMGSGKASVSDITISAGEMKYFMSEQKYDEPNGIFVTEGEKYDLSFLKIYGAQIEGNKVTYGDYSFYVENSIDPKYNFNSKEELEEEVAIEILTEKIKRAGNSKDELLEIFNSTPDELGVSEQFTGLGADAILKYLDDTMQLKNSNGCFSANGLKEFMSVPDNANLISVLPEILTPEKLQEIGFRRDQFTTAKIIGFASNILNDNSLEKDSKEYIDFENFIKTISEPIYKLVKDNPNLVNDILNRAGTDNLNDAMIEIFNGTDIKTEEETLRVLSDLVRDKDTNLDDMHSEIPNNKDFELRKNNETITEKTKNFGMVNTLAGEKYVSDEEKRENLKKVLNEKFSRSGIDGIKSFLQVAKVNKSFIIETASQWISNKEEIKSNNDFMKDFYGIVLEKGIQDEKVLTETIELNPNTSKKALEDFIEKSNDSSQEKMSSIVLFGKAVKQVEEELEENKALSNEKNNTNSLDSSDDAR